MLQRPTPEGTEDYVVFPEEPSKTHVDYDLELRGVAGLRLVEGNLELLDEDGTPQLRMSAPYLVGADGQAVSASVSLEGCEADHNPAAPWGRPLTAPGADHCVVSVDWSGVDIAYPALLDPSWSATGSMSTLRSGGVATRLNSGMILVSGGFNSSSTSLSSAELYDPSTGTFAVTGSMSVPRGNQKDVLLNDGRVLTTGGNQRTSTDPQLDTVEFYSPTSGTWTAVTATMSTRREHHSATLLNDGRVLIAGGGLSQPGIGFVGVEFADVFDPNTETFTPLTMAYEHSLHTAEKLPDGRVLVIGGFGSVAGDSDTANDGALAVVEVFDPNTDTFSTGASLGTARWIHASTTLSNGDVLVVGGATPTAIASTEVYSATGGTWSSAGNLSVARYGVGITRLPLGQVVVAGGYDGSAQRAEVDVFSAGSWSAGPSLGTARRGPAVVSLNNGRVLCAGGGSNPTYLSSAERGVFEAVASDKASYASGETVVASYQGMPGNPKDWVAVAVQGSALTSFQRFAYTNSAISGSLNFSGIPSGTYVLRSFQNNTYTLLAESAPFTYSSAGSTATITTDQSTYTSATNIGVSWTNLTGFYRDWVAIAVAGSADTQYVRWKYTNGVNTGSTTLTNGLPDGSYVARAFENNTFTKLAESAQFTVTGGVTTTVTTDASSYNYGDTITVSFSGMAGFNQDWVGLAKAGSADTSWERYAYTNGSLSGSRLFSNLPPGTYVARAFFNNSTIKQAESASFTVTGTLPTPVVSTDKSSYANTESVVVTFNSMAGFYKDWVAVAPVGAPGSTYSTFAYTNGTTSGTKILSLSGLPAGNYEVRAFFDNQTSPIQGTPAAFTITP